MKESGELFHIDFGFVLKIPSLGTPLMKISREMVADFSEEHLNAFRMYSCPIFKILRKYAGSSLSKKSKMMKQYVCEEIDNIIRQQAVEMKTHIKLTIEKQATTFNEGLNVVMNMVDAVDTKMRADKYEERTR